MADGFWKKEGAVAELKKLREERHSASLIAARLEFLFHAKVTRNAVISKLHRIGLPLDRGTAHRKKMEPGALWFNAPPAKPKKMSPAQKAFLEAPEPIPATEPDLVIPLAERKSLLELEKHDCRWPINDPQHADFHFCARKQVAGTPYCEFHVRRAFQPPDQPRRKFTPFPPSKVREREDA